MRRARLAAAAASVLALGVLLSGCASGGGAAAANLSTQDTHGFHGAALDEPYAMPTASFTTTDGSPFTLTSDATRPVTLLFFGYTHCPDLCNVVLANVASALRRSPQSVRDKVQLVFVTTDPKRDSPKVVREYLDRFDQRFEGLVGPVDDVAAAAKALYISYEKPDGSTGGAYEVDHGTYTTAFVGGSSRLVWSDTTSVADLRADLTRLVQLD